MLQNYQLQHRTEQFNHQDLEIIIKIKLQKIVFKFKEILMQVIEKIAIKNRILVKRINKQQIIQQHNKDNLNKFNKICQYRIKIKNNHNLKIILMKNRKINQKKCENQKKKCWLQQKKMKTNKSNNKKKKQLVRFKLNTVIIKINSK